MHSPAKPERLYMPELDGLRFIAFLLVFIHHLPFPDQWLEQSCVLARVHAFGWIGVDIFLVLSAYLLTRLALREIDLTGSFDVHSFFKRRILRIWPLYFFGLLLGFALYPVALWMVDATQRPDPWSSIRDHFIPYSFFVGNFSYAFFRGTLGLYKSLWTISLEEQFYLVFPLIVLLLSRHLLARNAAVIMIGAVIVSVLVRTYFNVASVPYPWVWVSPLSRLEPLAFGIGLGVFVQRRPTTTCGMGFLVTAAAGLMAVSAFPQLGASQHTVWQLLLSAGVSAGLLVAALSKPFSALLSHQALQVLGKLSFGLYVYHRFTLDIFGRATTLLAIGESQPLSWCLAALMCLVATVIVAALSYQLLELPFLHRKAGLEIVKSRPAAIN